MITTKTGCSINLLEFNEIVVRSDISSHRNDVDSKVSVCAVKIIHDANGSRMEDSVIIHEFLNVDRAQEFAAHLVIHMNQLRHDVNYPGKIL